MKNPASVSEYNLMQILALVILNDGEAIMGGLIFRVIRSSRV